MLAIAVVMQIPQWLHRSDPRSQGIPVHLNSDEHLYLARVEEALAGRPEQSAEAIVGDSRIVSANPAFLEQLEGTVFRWSGWHAPAVQQAMDSVTPPLVFLLLTVFFLLCGFPRRFAYAGALLFVLIEMYSLNRPVQQRDSFLLLLLALTGIIAGLERRFIFGLLGGMALGLLTGAYFWGWTFGWAWFGILFLLEGAAWLRRRTPGARHRVLALLAFGVTALLATLPALPELSRVLQHPLYAFAQFRSGMRFSHMPESWVYSALFAAMVAGVLAEGIVRPVQARRHRYAVITIVTAFIVIHQQALHGVVFDFVSHYLFSLAAAAVGVLLFALTLRSRPALLAGAAAAVYLCGLAWDGRHVMSQYRVRADRFGEQHLSTLLPALDALPRMRILSDPQTSLFLAGSTRHDVVYTVYLQNALMTHDELARRYCLTQLPLDPGQRSIATTHPLIYPAAERAFRDDPSVRTEEVRLVETACAAVDRDPSAALARFGVQAILWDEQRHPEWNLGRLDIALQKTGSGSGWSLWSLPSR